MLISPGHHTEPSDASTSSSSNSSSSNSATPTRSAANFFTPAKTAATAAATKTAQAAVAAAVKPLRTFGAVAFVTKDHSPYDAAEVQRITAAGGEVVCKLKKA